MFNSPRQTVELSLQLLILYHFLRLSARPISLPASLRLADRRGGWAVAEGPDLLCDPPPVRRCVQAAEQGVQAEVDPLHDPVRPRHVRIWGPGTPGVEEGPQ